MVKNPKLDEALQATSDRVLRLVETLRKGATVNRKTALYTAHLMLREVESELQHLINESRPTPLPAIAAPAG